MHMYTAVYMSESGNIEEKQFSTIVEASAFFKTLAVKSIPMKKFDREYHSYPSRLDEIEKMTRDIDDKLVNDINYFISNKDCANDMLRLIAQKVKLEVERGLLLKAV